MKRAYAIWMAAALLAVPALAQRGGEFGPRQRGGDGPGLRSRGGQDGERGRRGRGPSPEMLQQMVDRLSAELALEGEMLTQFETVSAQFLSDFESVEVDREQMRELAMAYREARRAGDMEEAELIRAQMREAGGGRREMVDNYFEEVKTVVGSELAPSVDEFRERVFDQVRRGRMRDRGRDFRQLAETLPDELNMDDEQRAAFELMLEERRAEMTGNRERFQELRPLMEEMREARLAGDDARAEELEAQLREMRPQRESMDEFFERVAEMLTEEQRVKLAEIQSSYMDTRRGAPERAGEDVRKILRAARKLDLDAEQRDKLRTLTREATQSDRGRRGGRRNAASRVSPGTTLKSQIMEMLTAEQKAEFEKYLAEDESRGNNRGQRDRGSGRFRGTGRGQPQ